MQRRDTLGFGRTRSHGLRLALIISTGPAAPSELLGGRRVSFASPVSFSL